MAVDYKVDSGFRSTRPLFSVQSIAYMLILQLTLTVYVLFSVSFFSSLPKSNLLHAADSVRRSMLMSALFLLVAIGIFIGSSSAALFPIMALLLVLADLAFILMPATLQIATSSEDSMRAAQTITQASHVQMRAGSRVFLEIIYNLVYIAFINPVLYIITE